MRAGRTRRDCSRRRCIRGGGQRAWPLLVVSRSSAGHVRPPRHAEFPRHEEPHMRRRRRADHQRPDSEKPRRDHPREGNGQGRFFRGEVDKYTWVDVGSSYLPSDILAAVLLAQLDEWERIQSRRRRAWEYYFMHLSDWAQHQSVRLPSVQSDCDQAFHMFFLVMPDAACRSTFIDHVADRGVQAVFHYGHSPLDHGTTVRWWSGRLSCERIDKRPNRASPVFHRHSRGGTRRRGRCSTVISDWVMSDP